MPLYISKDSHMDHALSDEVVEHLIKRFADKDGFFAGEFELPEGLTISCGAYGPENGDEVVTPDEIFMVCRNGRDGDTPLIKRPMRETQKFFIVAGPHDGHSAYLYTCYGGPQAPRETWDSTIADNPDGELDWANRYWATPTKAGHALAVPIGHCLVRIRDVNYDETRDRLSNLKISFQQIDKPTPPHEVTGETMQWLYVECTGNDFHKIIEDLAEVHFEAE
jgi:hypothetical protein